MPEKHNILQFHCRRRRLRNGGTTTGMLTRLTSASDCDGSVSVNTTNSKYVAEAFGYDNRERVAESVSVDHQGVALRESVVYSLSGLPVSTMTLRCAPDGMVENIASSLLVHEWYFHGIMNLDNTDESHLRIYLIYKK